MPELPEVETVRRGLQPVMEGARIEKVELRRPDLRFPFPYRFAERLAGREIVALGRRAKYLLVHLDNAAVIVCHLGMSGSFRVVYDSDRETASPGRFYHSHGKAEKHDHVIFHFSAIGGGSVRVIFNDPRRFGFMLLHENGALSDHPLLENLGVEPTGNLLDGAHLASLLQNRKVSLKTALMDQRVIAGLGNIYVCEALWRARLSPRRIASTIVSKNSVSTRSHELATSIRTVIAEAIEAGGSSLKDYVQADGALGYFQHRFNVYGRQGEPCTRHGCDGTIKRIVQGGRSTFYCSACQR